MKIDIYRLILSCFLSMLLTPFSFAEDCPENTTCKLAYGTILNVNSQQFGRGAAEECTVTLRSGFVKPKFYLNNNLLVEANKIEPIEGYESEKSWIEGFELRGGVIEIYTHKIPAHKTYNPHQVSFVINKDQPGAIRIESDAENENTDADVICKPKYAPAEMNDMTNNPG